MENSQEKSPLYLKVGSICALVEVAIFLIVLLFSHSVFISVGGVLIAGPVSLWLAPVILDTLRRKK